MLAFPKEMLEQDSSYDKIRVVITTKDNESINLSQDDMWTGSLTRSTATSNDAEFTVGAAVTGKLSFIINNIYGTYDKYDFHDSTMIAYLSGEYQREDGVYVTSDEVCLGRYIIDDYQYDGSTIYISGLDYMSKLDKEFNPAGFTFPITLKNLVTQCCNVCGVTFLQSDGSFHNSDFTVQKAIKAGTLTYHDIISYAAQIAASYAKVDTHGRLYFNWYNINAAGMGLIGYDGGKFDTDNYVGYSSSGHYYYKYRSGDNLNGGSYERRYINYTDSHGVARQRYADGDTADGGAFTERSAYHYFSNLFSLNTSTDEETITGVRVTVTGTYIDSTTDSDGYVTSEEKERTEIKTCPTTGYEGHIVEIEDNPLIALGQTQDVANRVGNIINGMKFRPLEATVTENPSVEAGDTAVVTDANGASYPVFISQVTYKNEGATTISCDSENANESQRRRYTVAAKTGRYVEETLERSRTAREIAMEYMYNLIRTSPGLYEYTEVDSNGATIYYLVNQMPDLSGESTAQILRDSKIRWKFTADAVAVSTNYGQTYPTGITATGTAVLNRIYAIGINADYINTGDLIVGGNTVGIGDMNGKILIKDADGTTIITMNKNGISFSGKASEDIVTISKDKITTEWLNAQDIIASSFTAETIQGKNFIIGPANSSILKVYMTDGELVWDNSSFRIEKKYSATEAYNAITISQDGGLRIGMFNISPSETAYYGGLFPYDICLISMFGFLCFRRQGLNVLTNIAYDGGYWGNVLRVHNNLYVWPGPQGFYGTYVDTLYHVYTYRQRSDRRSKKDIVDLSTNIYNPLTRSLKPTVFRLKDGDGRVRIGFIAQDVEQLLSPEEYITVNRRQASIQKDIDQNDETTYVLGIAYLEFVAPLVSKVKENQRRIEGLENNIKELRSLLQKIKGA